MNMVFRFLAVLLFFSLVLSCKKDKDNDNNNNNNNTPVNDSIVDIDGNVYKTIKIGNQTWMAENLKSRHFSNGDSIPLVENGVTWKLTNEAAACYYNNDPAHADTFGMLYNFYAITDSRNICPNGWRTPTFDDWAILVDYLGGVNEAATKLKSKTGWDENGTYNNSSQFTALPGGFRSQNGTFNNKNKYGYWWTSSSSDSEKAWTYNLDSGSSEVYSYTEYKLYGQSCRCIKN